MKEVQRLISKFIDGNLTEQELKSLKVWLSNEENRSLLKKDIQLDHLIKLNLLDFNTEEAYLKVKNKIDHTERQLPKNNNRIKVIIKYAAIFTGLLATGFFINNYYFKASDKLIIEEEQITLKLDNGNILTIDPDKKVNLTSEKGEIIASQNEDKLQYKASKKTNELIYNTLSVPNGKTFKLQLSDNTLVYLNSGSELRYPENFVGKERKVFLKGEAFFEVTKNKNAPFIVSTANKNITVLGTKFNVSAYNDISESAAVLLEGAIALNGLAALHDSILLHPNEMAAWDKNSNPDIKTVNPYDYTAWMEGKLVFNKKTFEEILARLEKKYNVTINNQYLELNDQRYQGSFDDIPVYEVLDTFKETRFFNYEIKNNTIIITRPAQ